MRCPRPGEPSQRGSPPGLHLASGAHLCEIRTGEKCVLGAIQSGVLGGVRGPISLRALSGSPDQRPEEQKLLP